MFPYSPRPGHAHGGRRPRAAARVKRRRAETLRALSDRLGHAHRAARVGQRDAVLVERVSADGRLHGYGADYTAYELRAQRGAGVGDLVEVVLEAAGERAALGEDRVIDRIDKDVKAAMKSGDATRRDALRLVLSSLRDAEKDARSGRSTDDEEQAVLRRELQAPARGGRGVPRRGARRRAAAEEPRPS